MAEEVLLLNQPMVEYSVEGGIAIGECSPNNESRIFVISWLCCKPSVRHYGEFGAYGRTKTYIAKLPRIDMIHHDLCSSEKKRINGIIELYFCVYFLHIYAGKSMRN